MQNTVVVRGSRHPSHTCLFNSPASDKCRVPPFQGATWLPPRSPGTNRPRLVCTTAPRCTPVRPHVPQVSVARGQDSNIRETGSSDVADGNNSEIPRASGLKIRSLLIDNYDSYTYNLFHLIADVTGVDPVVIRNDQLTWRQLSTLLYSFDCVVISPGPGSPTNPPDIGICAQLLRECVDVPILGVCMGHQALAYINGSTIIHSPHPIHGRITEVVHDGDGLYENIPSPFKVVRYHSLCVDPTSMSQHLLATAWTKEDGILMGITHKSRPHYGVQYHPESIATCHGSLLITNFARLVSKWWASHPRPPPPAPLPYHPESRCQLSNRALNTQC